MTEADFQTDLHSWVRGYNGVEVVAQAKAMGTGQSHRVFDLLLWSKDLFVILEIRYVRRAWIGKQVGRTQEFKLSEGQALLTFDGHVAAQNLPERITLALRKKFTVNEINKTLPDKGMAVFGVAIWDGSFQISSHLGGA